MRFFEEVPPDNSSNDDMNKRIEEVIATMSGEATPPTPDDATASHKPDELDDDELLSMLDLGEPEDDSQTSARTRALRAGVHPRTRFFDQQPWTKISAETVRRERGSWWERREARRNRLVPVRFFIGEGVPEAEARAAQQGIEDVLAASGQEREFVVATPNSIPAAEYYDPNDLVASALRRQRIQRDMGYGQQVDLQVLLDAMNENEPYQEPHLGVRVMVDDLTAEISPGEYLNFAFGATNPEDKVTVQSIARFMAEIPPGRLREEVVRRLFRHETGHLLGLPRTDRGHITQALGWHCTNICTMRQGMSVGEWAELTVQEYNEDVHFCRDCQHDLDRTKSNYRPL